jgi:predicted metal-binding membrane protein
VPSIATLALVAALAWAAVIFWSRTASMSDTMPGTTTVVGGLLFAGMWLAMMIAMMLPAVTPVVVLFRTLQRQRGVRGSPIVPTGAFVAGYLTVWTLAGVAADLTYMAAQALGARLSGGSGAVPIIGGAIIVLAGLYQFSPLKHVCLAHCRSPFQIIFHGWREGRLGALRMGAAHGVFCLGCCWGIMAVLFVVGLMNLGWMAALSVLIAIEKLAPRGMLIGRLVGVLFIALGVFMALQPRLFPPSGISPMHTMHTEMAPLSGMAPTLLAQALIQQRQDV